MTRLEGAGTACDRGFTLVELLVAMTLLALMTVLLFGGLRFGTTAWQRSDVHRAEIERIQSVQALLRTEIEQAYPYYLAGRHPGEIDFMGQSTALRLLGPLPNALGAAGRAYVTIDIQGGGGHKELRLAVKSELASPFQASDSAPLLKNIAGAAFAYYGADGAEKAARWHDRWIGKKSLPLLVRLHVKFPHGDGRIWPDLVVAPRIFADEACVYDAGTGACGDRE